MSEDKYPRLTVNERTITLERARVAARKVLSEQMAHDLTAHMYEDYIMRATATMIYELRTFVMRRQVHAEKQTVPFKRAVKAQFAVPTPKHVVWPAWVAALAFCSVGIAAGSLIAFCAACTFALCAVVALAQCTPYVITQNVEISGEVTVEDKLYDTFPDNTYVYPDYLGRPVPVVVRCEPEISYEMAKRNDV